MQEPLDQTTPNPGGEVQKAAENKENDVLFSNAKLPKGKRKARRKGEVQKKAAEVSLPCLVAYDITVQKWFNSWQLKISTLCRLHKPFTYDIDSNKSHFYFIDLHSIYLKRCPSLWSGHARNNIHRPKSHPRFRLQAPIIAAQERQLEEEMREREAALDDALDARAIRAEPLGQDRHYRSYWWFPGRKTWSPL